MRGIGERLDDKINQDTREHNDEPEYEDCPDCDGSGIEERSCKWHDRVCAKCDGTGQVLKVKFTIEEEGAK